ncbi:MULTISPECIES: histidine--tRNA ligase [Okeania]|uniref:Histidine--tRNA ligase n=1 Tax=Okeania hirsuta TaxID=1458930 RepID=A0A3N6Q2Q8_9CYAN|nr:MULTISPECIES: histidine--tRNA ligase [Okeania]NET12667.1 histidine--tRNA ligase [Okeania sp. SIO1H6]NES78092.1 histidine--tRNA ligase [Okeania sp. SIO1H4]NET18831.1 histidine--tRNA ligase [Okeania sp. SIO1H5]NET76857.1 histidine--tRNA ligase [Okeania sp. SIO1F9]NET94825.1 histidine--tRNA ligase [Okeania sp. SIO1H2]
MAKTDKINYSCPSGFPEFLPGEKRLESYLMDTIRQVFERYGFTPIETPAVERLEVLQAKGNQGDNIVYGLSPILPPNRQAEKEKAGDTGSEERALKFDQTVPLAAYIARHLNDLNFPFARYQMDVVFRGERAKDGRFRQFRQCDIDVVGRGKLSLLYDAQVPAIIAEIFEAINIGDFLIRINNRKVLTGFFASVGVAAENIVSCIRIVDTAEKVGEVKVKKALKEIGLSEYQVEKVGDFTNIKGSVDDVLDKLKSMTETLDNSEVLTQGISELETVISGVINLGVSDKRFCIDLSIARGLDYYTGTVYETTLIGHEALGSICSGGRYEELVGTFIGEKMPGVGISIGLTRLMSRLLKAGILESFAPTPATVMVVNMQEDLMATYLDVSQKLRRSGMNVITSFDSRGVGKQLQQADKQKIPFCIIIGSEEAAANMCSFKDLRTGEQMKVPIAGLAGVLKQRLVQ